MNTFPEQIQIERQSEIPGEPRGAGQFSERTLITTVAHILILILGLASSILLARFLGPEGQGIYTLTVLLPMLIVTFVNLGIGLASAYYVAQGHYPRQEVLGNNVMLAVGIGAIGLLSGLVVVVFFRQSVFHGVAEDYLLLALAIIPLNLLFVYLQNILLGAQRFKEYNLIVVVYTGIFLACLVVALWALETGVEGAVAASVIAWFLTGTILFLWTKRVAGGVLVKLNLAYLRRASVYGIRAHFYAVLLFLNARVSMFLINGFLNPAAVGLYTITTVLVEKLWLVSQAAGIVLFPRVSAETDETKRKEFTPLVARTVLWITTLGALGVFFLSQWIIVLMYSEAFLPSVGPLQILLPGIVALSVATILANDIAGRGRPMLNTYVVGIGLAVNVALNILWIPRHGIEGAALASTIAHSISLLGQLILYCRLSGNSWGQVLIPKRADWTIYRLTGLALVKQLKERVTL
jgi:O-antigen/teichoic acid export membrane protein